MLLALASVGQAGTQTAGDPNEPKAEFCDDALVTTDLEKVRCATKDAIVGAYSWLTSGTREEIDKALKECANGGSCLEADKLIDQLATSMETVDRALATHSNRASGKDGSSTLEEGRWVSRLRRAVGEDPTGFADAVKQYHFAREAKREATEASRTETKLRLLASANVALTNCISGADAGMSGTILVVHWRNSCQARRPFAYDLDVNLYDDQDRLIRGFLGAGYGYAFRMASPAMDGPMDLGTVVNRCASGGCSPLSEKPRQESRVEFDLRRFVAPADIPRVSNVKIEFKTF